MVQLKIGKNLTWLILAFIGTLPLVTCGDVLVTNLDQPYRASTPIGNTPPEEYWAAQSFVTDGVAWDLDSIQAIMGNAANAPAGIFELRRDTGANEIDLTAGGLLTAFAAPSLTGANSVRDFFPITAVQLDPGTQYWFMAGVTNGGTFEWDYANSGLFSGPGSLSWFGDSSDSGVTWNYHDSPFFPYFLQVNASPANVPEPATGVMGAACLAIACVCFRRRRPVDQQHEGVSP